MPQVRVASVMATQLWRNAEIVTMDAAMPRARALVVRDGLVDFVGSEDAAIAQAGAGDKERGYTGIYNRRQKYG